MKINGEFVSGVQSWASLSLMRTREDIQGDGYGYIPRPTDQLMNFSLFFQDYLPGNPSWKMHLAAFYGSRLPTGPPNSERWQDIFRMPPYRRIDLGLSRVFCPENDPFMRRCFLRYTKQLWLGFDCFNLLNTENVNSYYWVTDISNTQWSVPNYLTGRLLNLRLTAEF